MTKHCSRGMLSVSHPQHGIVRHVSTFYSVCCMYLLFATIGMWLGWSVAVSAKGGSAGLSGASGENQFPHTRGTYLDHRPEEDGDGDTNSVGVLVKILGGKGGGGERSHSITKPYRPTGGSAARLAREYGQNTIARGRVAGRVGETTAAM
jgi:hypothetical protein